MTGREATADACGLHYIINCSRCRETTQPPTDTGSAQATRCWWFWHRWIKRGYGRRCERCGRIVIEVPA